MFRRIYRRFIADGSLLFDAGDGERRFLLKDLSASGAGVFGGCPLVVGDTVGVTIVSPFFFDLPVPIKARVAWCNRIGKDSWEAGLYFDKEKIKLPSGL